ncbi:SDR family oxidoreductase [Paenibacillus sp. NEAU-GSW1]|uniref:SDR family oxidoreductase n=1 Tax=Paenibacillus sp. NEAU-GSW1 TaxID=2682486 RepID=UPI0012E27CF0|nr:SDR family oxidoreductase [Paenibacillus sp. NEAU-GSW1]MUT66950.1 glucose 1-dehydrogenase [Paenibacillus sp. NEAU-GSW1]
MRLDGKVAVVTGAGSGMGREIALLFAKEGAKVVVSDLNEQSAQATVDQITAEAGTAVLVVSNVAIEEDVQKMIDTAVEKFGTLDILINNAGIMDGMVPAHEVTDAQWERVFAVNATGPMRAIRKALPIFMEKGQGTIVNIASVGGLFGSRAGAAYTAAKHAVVGLTKNVGYQYAKNGIRANAIAPGGVNTNIGVGSTAPNEFGMSKTMPGMAVMPRLGEPSEIAKVALFLASDDSSFVNGTVVTADAGWTSY